MTVRTISLALAAASAFLTPAAAVARDSQNTQRVRIAYKDLDLSTEAGQKELDRRVDKAAREVCGMDQARTGTRLPGNEARQCYNTTRAQLGESLSSVTGNRPSG